MGYRKRQRGFSLVELMIVMALLGVLISVMSSYFVQSSRNQNGLEKRSNFHDFITELRFGMSTAEGCASILRLASTPPPLFLKSSLPTFANSLADASLTIPSIDVQSTTLTAPAKRGNLLLTQFSVNFQKPISTTQPDTYVAKLEVSSIRPSPAPGATPSPSAEPSLPGANYLVESIPIKIQLIDFPTDPTYRKILTCQSDSTSSGGTITPTICTGGTIMIGIDENGPVCGLAGGTHLAKDEALPAGSKALSCDYLDGKRVKNISCSGKFTCVFSGGVWKLMKNGNFNRICDAGVEVDEPAAGSFFVNSTDGFPGGFDSSSSKVTCEVSGSDKEVACDDYDTSGTVHTATDPLPLPTPSPSTAIKAPNYCMRLAPSGWVVLTYNKKRTATAFTITTTLCDSILVEPL